MSSRTEERAGFAGINGFVSTHIYELTTSHGVVRNNPVIPANPARTPQDCHDAPGDIVIGIIEKKPREAYEVRLRDVRGGPKPVRSVLIRLCRKIPDGRWMPMNEGSRCGLTIAASQLSAVIDMLERAEDVLADEEQLP